MEREGLGYSGKKKPEKNDKKEDEIAKRKVIERAVKSMINHISFVPKSSKPNSEKKDGSKLEIKENLNSDKLKQDEIKIVNIGLISQKHLKHKLKEIKKVDKVNEPRKNIEGVNKSNNYMPITYAPRKKFHNCGNPNHLITFCRNN